MRPAASIEVAGGNEPKLGRKGRVKQLLKELLLHSHPYGSKLLDSLAQTCQGAAAAVRAV
jgi:hypothetical protein